MINATGGEGIVKISIEINDFNIYSAHAIACRLRSCDQDRIALILEAMIKATTSFSALASY